MEIGYFLHKCMARTILSLMLPIKWFTDLRWIIEEIRRAYWFRDCLCKIAFPEGLPPIWHKKSMFLTNINLFEPNFNTIKNSGQKIYPRDFTAPEKFMKFETFWTCWNLFGVIFETKYSTLSSTNFTWSVLAYFVWKHLNLKTNSQSSRVRVRATCIHVHVPYLPR